MAPLRERKPVQEEPEEDFDDEAGLDALEDSFPQLKSTVRSAKPIIDPIVNEVLPPGIIDIHQEVGSLLSTEETYRRIHHHLQDSDLGFRRLSHDRAKLRVKPRAYPLFGAFIGTITYRENIAPIPGAHAAYRRIDIDGYLKFRPSALFVGSMAVLFLLVLLATRPGLGASAMFLLLGVGITTLASYRLGRGEDEEVEERLAESFMRLRATVHNRR